MKKIPVSIFAYNFPHKKTQDFIFKLLAEGYEISEIFAANPVKLNIPKSSIKSKINHLGLTHPEKIARNLGIKYFVVDHDSPVIIEEVANKDCIGIIAGARILKPKIIDAFKYGIINFHPGIIPFARGLDALLWSIYNDSPLGVTAHLIDKQIDAGKILNIKEIDIFHDDTILDLSERLYDLQIEMLPDSLERAMSNSYYTLDEYGSYNRKMEIEKEQVVINEINKYVEKRSSN